MDSVFSATENRDALLLTVLEHWAKARIDGPLQLVGRLDDTAKQIIAVAGIVQAALIGIAKIGDELTVWGLGASGCLLLAIVLAAYVIKVPPDDLWADQIYKDLRASRDDAQMEHQLDGRFETWCTMLGNAVELKRKRLTASILVLTLGLLLSVACLVESMGGLRAVIAGRSREQRVEMVRPHLPPR